jgi:thymidine phosphorylase
MSGNFFFVVGPSGAGKDSLLSGVQPLLPQGQFIFARRVITREAVAHTEDHDSCSEAEFLAREKNGDFLITWQAHGLMYGLPASLLDAIASGMHVIANGSRNMIEPLQRKVPSLKVIEVNAPLEVLRARLNSRSRESPEEIERRLQRASLALPSGVPSVRVMNDLNLDIGVSRLKAALLLDAVAPGQAEHFLYQKIGGSALSRDSYAQLLPAIIRGGFPLADVQTFLVACTLHLTHDEIVGLAYARTLLYPRLAWPQAMVVDKHSMGGIPGSRVTMVVIPIVAAHGLLIPKTSSRAITSAAGTADAMEVLARVDLNFDEVQACVLSTKGCIVWNGKLNHSVLDDAINPIVRPFGLDTRNWSVASILSKKFTAGATHVVIDIPYAGSGKVKTLEEASELARLFESVGSAMGLVVKAFPTDGSGPIGCGIGPALEARDVMQVLDNHPQAPADLRAKSLFFAAHILALDPAVGSFDNGHRLATELLESGAARRRMDAIVAQQGLVPADHQATQHIEVRATQAGLVRAIDGGIISGIARQAGAPGLKLAGVDLKKSVGDKVHKGELLYLIQGTDMAQLQLASQLAEQNHGYALEI